jgi:hypothetical protein
MFGVTAAAIGALQSQQDEYNRLMGSQAQFIGGLASRPLATRAARTAEWEQYGQKGRAPSPKELSFREELQKETDEWLK